jgi:flagellar hook-associated protein 2
MSFDADKFAAALAADPAATQDVVQQLAARIRDAATVASDPYTGVLTTKIAGQQSSVADLTDQIADWDTRLANRRASLEQTYANLEVQLNNIKSQSSWLASQLAGLPTTSNS